MLYFNNMTGQMTTGAFLSRIGSEAGEGFQMAESLMTTELGVIIAVVIGVSLLLFVVNLVKKFTK